ncbi:hypothetical protein FB45DRAFT_1034359 [Roridomyces roridus]|uniref:F-box domain-containing protein n=1 Tax=Roridomyces roridus TaxID=1738132 RepID=A0AAD7FFA7_9AGAR|nr:hypothetical protein FB45DRAFT_1034359 [Roridomyces roridus]
MASPMQVQELVDHCLIFLDSPNLRACALVTRAWAANAQAHLFRRVSFRMPTAMTNEQRWYHLHSAPHLMRHVQYLEVVSESLPPAVFDAICRSPLLRPQHASIDLGGRALASLAATALQEFVSQPTLRRLKFRCNFADPALFLLIWARCSPAIRHLDLAATDLVAQASGTPALPLEPIPPHAKRTRLTTLAITASSHGVNDWLFHELSPFDCTSLKALSILGHPQLTGWVDTSFPPTIRNIEIFDFVAWGVPPVITLSAFPRLRILRLHLRGFPYALPVLATLSSSSAIQKIVLTLHYPLDDSLQDVDRRMCELPIDPLPVVELEIALDGRWWRSAKKRFFPLLDANSRIQRVDPPTDWLSDCIASLGG